MKLDHLLTSHTRKNSNWIQDLNVRPKTIKILEENIGSKISDIAHGNILLDISPQARETKAKINKWDFIKLKASAQQSTHHFQTSALSFISNAFSLLFMHIFPQSSPFI